MLLCDRLVELGDRFISPSQAQQRQSSVFGSSLGIELSCLIAIAESRLCKHVGLRLDPAQTEEVVYTLSSVPLLVENLLRLLHLSGFIKCHRPPQWNRAVVRIGLDFRGLIVELEGSAIVARPH